jgi:cellulose synthase/poly-beta-1,6-N-acetylglucosamine synthase-like glycosyltransferase
VTTPTLAQPSTALEQQAYEHYLRVRDEVVRMKAAAGASPTTTPSAYWNDELATIDYISEASPLIIRKLRHHSVHITGLRPYDYRRFGERQEYFERRLEALIALAGGRALLVPEAEALGGFGYRIEGQLYNVDTIKFFEVLVGMQRAAVLEPFSRDSSRRMVWEIGGGWGGFAYQLKRLFPNTTYVIVDFAELFLFSATYLSTLFPGAAIRFWREDRPVFERWEEADFIFIPHDRVEVMRASRPDLLVNLVSFHEMTSAQVDAYMRLAAAIGCPTLYSLNRDRSVYNDELEGVGHILSRQYDVREVRLLGSDYTKATKKGSAVSVEEAPRLEPTAQDRYRHLVGTLPSAPPHRRAPVEGREEHDKGAPDERMRDDSRDVGRPSARRQAIGRDVGQSARRPLVGIGVTLHNRAAFLREALDSLLAQSYPHFRLVLVDDGSDDATGSIAREYEGRDARVRYVRFDERRGMIAAWRNAFELATAEVVDYFAWASDHDRWDRRWLETLVAELESHPQAVLAYPLTERMDPSGIPLAKPARRFETIGVTDLIARWRHFSRSDAIAAGDMVYGLMRPAAVKEAGIFRAVLCPDRLLIAELTMQGQIRQVPHILWHRRQFSTGSISRQRSSLFAPDGPRPGRLATPWWMHARVLWETYGKRAEGPARGGRFESPAEAGHHSPAEAGQHRPASAGLHQGALRRATVARLVVTYTVFYALRHYAKTPTQRDLVWVLQRPRWAYKRAKHGMLVAIYALLVFARRVGITPALERACERLTGSRRPWRRGERAV